MINLFKKIIILGLLALGVPGALLAAEIFFDSGKNVFPSAGEFLVEIYLDTEDESVNAVEGTVSFPAELLQLKDIRDGNSSVNFWVEKPRSEKEGSVRFSGITTGGLVGSKKLLFGMVLEGKSVGQGQFSFSEVKVLKNDGSGGSASIKMPPFAFSLSSSAPGDSEDLSLQDTDAPESFLPFVGQDAEIFEGKYFVVFSTVDKGSGVDRYEVKEGRWGKYKEAESPHVLEDQSLRSPIFVKAYDKAGNERVAKVPAQNSNAWLELAVVLVIILTAFTLWRKKIWRKSVQS